MTSLKNISMSELVERGQGRGLGVTKSGVRKEGDSLVDPFELGVSYPVEFTEQKISRRPSGTPQVELSVSIMLEDGALEPGGRVWLDLPVKEALTDLALTAAEEATFLTKGGQKFLKFLRAIDPERYSVFCSIDKTDPVAWRWLDFNGGVLTAEARTKLADDIDKATVAVACGVYDGTVSLKGTRCVLTKQPNPHALKYPYVNFTAFPAEIPF